MAETKKRFILARASAWNAEGFDKSLYNDSIVFIHNGETNEAPGKCVAIYTKGVEYPVGKALSGDTITKAFAGNGTVTYTTTGTKLDGTSANITALSFKEGNNITITVDESGALVITGKDWTTEIENAVANKNVTASGDTYVSAFVAEGTNHVTVAATQEIIDAVSYADSALQTLSGTSNDYVQASFAGKAGDNGAKTDVLTVELTPSTITSLGKADTAVQNVETGTTSGTIKVDGTEVSVAGLGSAAYTESTAYDAAGAASTVKTELLGDATEAGNTLGKLEDRIETIVTDAKTYSIAKVEGELGENVKEAFKLVDEDGTQVGETINIYKDSSLINIELVDTDKEGNAGQFLKYTYVLANGTEQEVYVDANKFLVQSEFKDGLQVSDAGEVSVKVDSTSEDFLTVSENGVKVSGIADAISAAVGDKNVSAEGDKYVTASADNNKVTIATVTGSVSANEDKLAICSDVKTYVDGKFDALDATLTADNKAGSTTTGYINVITGINQADGLVSISATESLPTGEEVARQAAKATTEVVKDEDSEDYLTITEDNTATDEHTKYVIGVSGIDSAISTAIENLDSIITVDNSGIIEFNSAHDGKVYESIELKDGKLVEGANTQTRVKYVDNSKLTHYSTTSNIKYVGIAATDTISEALAKCEEAWDWSVI